MHIFKIRNIILLFLIYINRNRWSNHPFSLKWDPKSKWIERYFPVSALKLFFFFFKIVFDPLFLCSNSFTLCGTEAKGLHFD